MSLRDVAKNGVCHPSRVTCAKVLIPFRSRQDLCDWSGCTTTADVRLPKTTTLPRLLLPWAAIPPHLWWHQRDRLSGQARFRLNEARCQTRIERIATRTPRFRHSYELGTTTWHRCVQKTHNQAVKGRTSCSRTIFAWRSSA